MSRGLGDVYKRQVQSAVPGHSVSAHEAEECVEAPAFAAALDVSCADGVGLIARVTEFVAEEGLSLSKLETKTEGAPHGGTQLFSLSGVMLSKDRVNEAKLVRGFKDLELEMGVNIDMCVYDEAEAVKMAA